MAEVMEKSIVQRVQEALKQDISSAEAEELKAAINTERSNLNVRAFELAQVPATDGTPEEIAQRRMDAQTAKAAGEQLAALANALERKLRAALKREGFENREALTKKLVKAVERAAKMTAQCNACWQDADEALEALAAARSNATGRIQHAWPEESDGKALEAIRAALAVCSVEWRNVNQWDMHESQDARNFAHEIG